MSGLRVLGQVLGVGRRCNSPGRCRSGLDVMTTGVEVVARRKYGVGLGGMGLLGWLR